MKNLLKLLFIFFFISIFSQEKRNGISYQALIINPSGEELPGYNNQNSPLVNTSICLEFIFKDENGTIEYSEYQTVTTDQYGMVNIVIGNGGVFAGGYAGNWSGIVWSEKSKSLTVNLDTTAACSDFSEISTQELTSVPFALFAPGQDGRDGEDGKSAYQIWLDAGNSGSEQDFIDSLKGDKGDKGDDGNDGADGSSGDDGSTGLNSLINTTVEPAGANCSFGGIKIESGLDSDASGTLESGEVTQTQYICNGNDGEDGADGEDGTDGADGSGSGSKCFSFDILGVVETTMDASGITHDANYSQYPNVASGLLSSNISGTNMNFTSLNTNKFVISSTGQERLPEYELSIKAYDSGGALLDLSIKIEQYYWVGRSDYGPERNPRGGGFTFFGALNEPRTTTFYYEGNNFDSKIGGKRLNRGGIEAANEYGMNLEILSNKTIDRITLTYTPVNWTTAGAGYNRSKIINSFIKYKCSTVSTNIDSDPPTDLSVGDYWGGGIVFYVAQPNDPIYVEGEKHGLIAPINWRSVTVSGTSHSTWRWAQFTGTDLQTMYQSFTESMFEIGGGETLTNSIATTYINNSSNNEYNEENWPSSYGNPWVNAYHTKLNGYDDWFIPNNIEVSKLRQYMGVSTGSGNNKNNNILASTFIPDVYIDSGYWRGGSYNYAVSPNCQAWNNGSGQCFNAVYYIVRAF